MLCTSLQAWCLCVCYCWVNQEGKWSIKENCIKLKLGRETGGKPSRIRLGKGGTAGRKVIQREGISDRQIWSCLSPWDNHVCDFSCDDLHCSSKFCASKRIFWEGLFFFFHLHGSCLFLPRSDVILCSHDVYATSLSFETTKTSTYKWCLQNKVISSPSGYKNWISLPSFLSTNSLRAERELDCAWGNRWLTDYTLDQWLSTEDIHENG